MSRILQWSELSEPQRAQAMDKLRRLELAKARYDGTVMPYAWPDRIASLLRYTMFRGGIWDCNVPLAQRRKHTIFDLPILTMEAVA